MSSLRTRLLAGVLLLSAAGLVLLGVVTYAEQSSFLLGRVDNEARASVNALSLLLDREGFKPPAGAAPTKAGSGAGANGAGAPAGATTTSGGTGTTGTSATTLSATPIDRGPGPNLPPGTDGQRRTESGKVLGSVPIRYSATETVLPAPRIPASVPLGKLFTVGSVGSTGLRYRVYAQRDPEDLGVTIVAVPLN